MEATQATPVKYDMEVVRWFTIMAVVYAVVGTLVGVYVASELAWPFYQQPPGMAVEWHVNLLTALADLYRVQLRDRAQADPWERKAVDVMAAVATRGAPPAEGETPFRYLNLLMDLGMRLRDLDDVEAAVPWYQMAARRGYEPAQQVLKELGRSW